jgi:hypothetical protein
MTLCHLSRSTQAVTAFWSCTSRCLAARRACTRRPGARRSASVRSAASSCAALVALQVAESVAAPGHVPVFGHSTCTGQVEGCSFGSSGEGTLQRVNQHGLLWQQMSRQTCLPGGDVTATLTGLGEETLAIYLYFSPLLYIPLMYKRTMNQKGICNHLFDKRAGSSTACRPACTI